MCIRDRHYLDCINIELHLSAALQSCIQLDCINIELHLSAALQSCIQLDCISVELRLSAAQPLHKAKGTELD